VILARLTAQSVHCVPNKTVAHPGATCGVPISCFSRCCCFFVGANNKCRWCTQPAGRPANVWPLQCKCLALAVQMFGPCSANAWPLQCKCLALAVQMFGPCSANAWPLQCKCLALAVQMLGPCSANVWPLIKARTFELITARLTLHHTMCFAMCWAVAVVICRCCCGLRGHNKQPRCMQPAGGPVQSAPVN
jgi:hypothetical protein